MKAPRSGGRVPAPQRGHSRVGQGCGRAPLRCCSQPAAGVIPRSRPLGNQPGRRGGRGARGACCGPGRSRRAAGRGPAGCGRGRRTAAAAVGYHGAPLRSSLGGRPGAALLLHPEEQCRSDEPVYEFAVIVEGYTLDPVFLGEDSAQFVVIFDEVGALWPDRMADPLGTAPETLSLKRMAGRWRLVGPDAPMPEHLSRNGVLRRFRACSPTPWSSSGGCGSGRRAPSGRAGGARPLRPGRPSCTIEPPSQPHPRRCKWSRCCRSGFPSSCRR